MRKYSYYYKIADINIHIKIPFKFKVQDQSKNFINDTNDIVKSDILIDFIQIDKPVKIEGEVVFKNAMEIYNTKQGFVHVFYSAPGSEPYAWLIPINDNYYEVKYIKGKETYLEYSRNILEIINIEQILNKKGAFMLHSSFIKYKDKAILFSAPSGTGKSTQADLWNNYENAEIINGDRAGIQKINNKWRAYGLPYAGSSYIFKNKSALLSNIIVLRQGKENKLRRLSPREAFIKIYSETTVHTWDSEFQENIINMVTDLVQEIPVYLYECLPDKSAVDFLKSTIEGDEK